MTHERDVVVVPSPCPSTVFVERLRRAPRAYRSSMRAKLVGPA
jgi:hypothetical protein